MRKWVVGALVVVMIALGVLWWIRPQPQRLLDEFVAELRARGEPVTLADLEPPLPPENGAPAVQRALLVLDARAAADRRAERDPWEMRLVGPDSDAVEQPWHLYASPEQLDELRRFVASIDNLYAEVDTAIAAGSVVWPLAESDHDAVRSEYALTAESFVTELLFLLRARARVATSPAERHRALRACVAFTALPRPHGTLDHCIWAARRNASIGVLRDLVEVGAVDGARLRDDLDRWLLDAQRREIPRALRADRAILIAMFPELLDGSIQAAQRSAERTLESIQSETPPPPPTVAERVRFALEDEVEAWQFDGEAYVHELRTAMGRLPALGSWSRADEAEVSWAKRSIARLNHADAVAALARVALAACVHYDRHGSWPAAASDLEPLFSGGVPLDPYTEQPFELVVDDGGFLLRAQPAEGDLWSDESLRDLGLEWRLPAR